MLAYLIGTSGGVALSIFLTGAGMASIYLVFSGIAAGHLFCSYRYFFFNFHF